jgi:hypothetical protein
MVQLHPEDDCIVVVEVEAVDLIITTMKAQAQAQDFVIPKRSSNWTYSLLKVFKTRVGSRKTTRKYS